MEKVPVVHHPMFDAWTEIWCVLLDVEMGLHTVGEMQGVLQPMPMGLDTVVQSWAECALPDIEVGLDDTPGELQGEGEQGVLQSLDSLDTEVEPWAECTLLDVEMRRWLGGLSLSSAENYLLILSFGLKYHLGSHSLGLFHD